MSERERGWTLLILRLAAVFLVATFGREKAHTYVALAVSGKSVLAGGLAPLVAALGFPFPGVLALFAAIAESVGATLVGIGLFARPAAALCAASMAGAFYSSIRLKEDPIRALLYFGIFAAIAAAGPGRYAWAPGKDRGTPPSRFRAAIWILRGTVLASIPILVFDAAAGGSKFFSKTASIWPFFEIVLLMLIAGSGMMARPACAILAVVWAGEAGFALWAGQPWFVYAVRAGLYVFVFSALAVGSGKFRKADLQFLLKPPF